MANTRWTGTEIQVRRFTLRSDMYRYASFGYEYRTPVDIDWRNADGTTRPGPRAGSWTPAPGKGIADARRILKGMFPGAELTETWKQV